jgi:DNA-binding MarR family transcriptional regulator
MTDREQIIEQIGEFYKDVSRTLNALTIHNWLDLNLTMGQLKALLVLSRNDSITVGVLGQMLRIQLPAASHAADSLVRLELAQRYEDPADRRRTFIRLTPQGQTRVTQLQQGRRELLRTWLVALDDEDLAALLRGLKAITTVIPALNEPEPHSIE